MSLWFEPASPSHGPGKLFRWEVAVLGQSYATPENHQMGGGSWYWWVMGEGQSHGQLVSLSNSPVI